ncbi:hypothetical protein OW492_04515 [Psychromonas sp. 14N.309.X.WAT.B.A12]|uniref:hypothetical protein n=1 Tax=Psychromonas sp. 14N.309.X.WAT.B.A12 TaxID=2998322 RepID=UPI0025AF159B|nr:hypothetical protein [Psychromonas sp. 14N.309.X.WAT.B.A12]MDN2662639.1 hypothetical protein [Psychromonas sp. 14N.309.X.WAT.B.A12]
MIYQGMHITNNKDVDLLVCHVSFPRKKAAIISMHHIINSANFPKPTCMDFSELEMLLQQKSTTQSQFNYPAEMSYSDRALKNMSRHNWLKKRDIKFAAIEPLTDYYLINKYLYGEGLGREVQELCDNKASHLWNTRGAYYNALNRYIVYGCTLNALLPTRLKNTGQNYYLPADISEPNKKRGRGGSDNRSSRSKSLGVTKHNKESMKKIISYMKSKEGKKQFPKFTYYKAIELYQYNFESSTFQRTIDDITTETRIPFEEADSLSTTQLRYHFKNIVNKTEYLKIRHGHIGYEKDHADRQGSSHDGVLGSTFRYEIDATILDIYVRYPYDTSNQVSMGRPVLYLVIDVFSTAIVGFYIGFDGPNWGGSSQSLINACSDKVEFAAKYGVSITEDEWPAHHIPVELTVDNGSEHPNALINSILNSEIGIRGYNFTAVYRGDAKGIVERKFKAINDISIHHTPGSLPELPKRGEQHASNQALYDYDSLMAEMIHTIVLHNNSADRLHRFDINAIRSDIDITPNALFKHSLKQEMNGGRDARKVNPGRIHWAFLPEEMASVRADGIYLDGLVYYSDYAKNAGWFTKAKHHGAFKVAVKRWRQWTSSIWHKTPDNQYVSFDLKNVNDESPFSGMHWEPVLHLLEQFKDKRHSNALNRKKLNIYKSHLTDELKRLNEEMIKDAPENTRLAMNPGIKTNKASFNAIQKLLAALEYQEQLNIKQSEPLQHDHMVYSELENDLYGED